MTSVDLKVIDFKESKNSLEKLSFDVKNISEDTIAYVLHWQRARRRSGSANTKEMSEISGTTAKPYNQKGTGNARQGSRRSVQFVGGRACFGPKSRSFDYALPKKIAQKAMVDALKIKLSQKEVILSQFSSSEVKTSYINSVLKANEINNVLFLYDSEQKESQNLVKSVRNIKNTKALDIKAINVYDLLRYNFVILDKSLLENIKKIIG